MPESLATDVEVATTITVATCTSIRSVLFLVVVFMGEDFVILLTKYTLCLCTSLKLQRIYNLELSLLQCCLKASFWSRSKKI